MRKRLFALLLSAALLLPCLPHAQATEPEIDAPCAILMDVATGTVLFEKNADEKRPPASVTKIMTLLLVLEALDSGKISRDDTVTASEAAAAKGGSQIYLEVGEQMSMDEMLKSVVVSSANDCATALAEHVAGSEAAFVGLMNRRAAELGMTNTYFVNCTGLDDESSAAGHLSSARDIAIMSRALLQHKEIRNYTTIWMDSVRDGRFGLTNTNKLVRFYSGTTGLKTGYTSKAGHCISASAERDGMELIAVILNESSSQARFQDAKALLNYGFANYALLRAQPDEAFAAIPVRLGTAQYVQPQLAENNALLVEKGVSVRRSVTLDEELTAPVAQGQQVGTLTLETDTGVLAEIPILAPESVERLSWWELTVRVLRKMCMG